MNYWLAKHGYDKANYLAHHGILGMHWGIRRFQNKDGSLTAEGRKRYQVDTKRDQPKVHNIMAKAKYNDDVSDEIFNALHADKKYLKEARNILQDYTDTERQITKEVDKTFSGLRDDDNLHIYEAASELADTAKYYNKSVDDYTLSDLAGHGFHGVLDDGQQGTVNAYSMYASKNHLEQKVDELVRKSDSNRENARKDAIEAVTNGLIEVDGASLTASPNNDKYKLPNAIVQHMMNSDKFGSWKATNGSYYANSASHALSFTDQDKENIDKAERYVRKINHANDENTWWYVNEAAEILGLDSVRLSNMSQTDWNRVNRVVQRLKDED